MIPSNFIIFNPELFNNSWNVDSIEVQTGGKGEGAILKFVIYIHISP